MMEYRLLQSRLRHENALKHHKELDESYQNDRKYKFAAQRLNLYNEKFAIKHELGKMAPAVRIYYVQRLKEISDNIKLSRKAHPSVKTVYDY